MSAGLLWGVIGVMALVNFVLRFVPMASASRAALPDALKRFLSYVPVSVMAALVTGEVLHPAGDWPLPWHNPYLMAAVPTALVYSRWRSLPSATIAGMAFFLGARALLAAL